MGSTPPQQTADHFCVLVHGLWGNPAHLEAVRAGLRERYGEDKLHILVAKSNTSTYTYDGIDVGAERVAQEVEDELKRLDQQGYAITKISVVGYSLGGLIARYCIGLLYSRGWFDRLEPINFTAIASPFLGVRTPSLGYRGSLWNVLGSRTLSTSGRQLFLIDSFRDTGRPIISVLADPESIFFAALSRFKNRALYANVTNDRSVPWYTASMSDTDPFEDLDAVSLNYLEGYHNVVVDPEKPVRHKHAEDPGYFSRLRNSTQSFLKKVPFYSLLVVLTPISATMFLINSGFQSFRSQQRIKLHNQGQFLPYQIPLMVEGAIESINAHEEPEHLDDQYGASPAVGSDNDPEKPPSNGHTAGSKRTQSKSDLPTLALTPGQFEMIRNLDTLKFRKWPVHIQRHRHSHAAIIVRRKGYAFEEGREVVKHWLDNEFEI